MTPVVFEDLPVDILIEIMQHMANPRDLFAFVRVSKHILQCFYSRSNSILESVIQNAIPPEILVDAINACKASRLVEVWYQDGDRGMQDMYAGNFFISYSYQRKFRAVIRASDQELLYSICKLWWILDDLTSQFYQQAASKAKRKKICFRDSSCHVMPSELERMMAFRAFLRFEIYRKLFVHTIELFWPEEKILMFSKLHNDNVTKLRKSFLHLFTGWEQEEILSIYEFLLEYVLNWYRELQDFVCQELHELISSKTWRECQDRVYNGKVPELAMVVEKCKIDVWNGQHSKKGYFECLIMRGLPFLRWVSTLSLPDRIAVLASHGTWVSHSNLLDLLKIDYEWDLRPRHPVLPENHDKSFAWYNLGWSWAAGNSREGALYPEMRTDLRNVGYVFWDDDRFDKDYEFRLAHLRFLAAPCWPFDSSQMSSWWKSQASIQQRMDKIRKASEYSADMGNKSNDDVDNEPRDIDQEIRDMDKELSDMQHKLNCDMEKMPSDEENESSDDEDSGSDGDEDSESGDDEDNEPNDYIENKSSDDMENKSSDDTDKKLEEGMEKKSEDGMDKKSEDGMDEGLEQEATTALLRLVSEKFQCSAQVREIKTDGFLPLPFSDHEKTRTALEY